MWFLSFNRTHLSKICLCIFINPFMFKVRWMVQMSFQKAMCKSSTEKYQYYQVTASWPVTGKASAGTQVFLGWSPAGDRAGGRIIHDLPAGWALCVQHWELCTGLLVIRRVYPAAALSSSLYSHLCKILQSVGLGFSGRMNHLAECTAQAPTLLPCSRLWEMRGCPTAHRKLREASRNSPSTNCVPLPRARVKTAASLGGVMHCSARG